MTIEEQLKLLILQKYKSIRAFSLETGIPYSTIDNIFKRGIGNIGITTAIKISTTLGIDVDGLAEGVIRNSVSFPSKDEGDSRLNDIIDIYNEMNEQGKEHLHKTALHCSYDPEYKKPDDIHKLA